MLVKKKMTKDQLLELEDITKEFDKLIMRKQTKKKMKIRYNNPEDEDKYILVESLDDIIEVKKEEIHIEEKTGEYIKLMFNIPKTEGTYKAHVLVKNKKDGKIEEVLKFNIQVVP